ncbi:MAG TPA: hypothetical protein VJ845_00560 [Haploplasma sp.]|nr:hypothetical protein [Haploplasma sp.]
MKKELGTIKVQVLLDICFVEKLDFMAKDIGISRSALCSMYLHQQYYMALKRSCDNL